MAAKQKRTRKPKESKELKIPGRPSKFRGKNRNKPIQIYMTDRGLEGLERGCSRNGETRPEYIERLILQDNGMA